MDITHKTERVQSQVFQKYRVIYEHIRYRDKLTLLQNYLVSPKSEKYVTNLIATIDSIENDQKNKYVKDMQLYGVIQQTLNDYDIADEDFVRMILVCPDARLSKGMLLCLSSLLRLFMKVKPETSPTLIRAIIDAIECPDCCMPALNQANEYLPVIQDSPEKEEIVHILKNCESESILALDELLLTTDKHMGNLENDIKNIEDMFTSNSLLLTVSINLDDAAEKRMMIQSWIDRIKPTLNTTPLPASWPTRKRRKSN